MTVNWKNGTICANVDTLCSQQLQAAIFKSSGNSAQCQAIVDNLYAIQTTLGSNATFVQVVRYFGMALMNGAYDTLIAPAK